MCCSTLSLGNAHEVTSFVQHLKIERDEYITEINKRECLVIYFTGHKSVFTKTNSIDCFFYGSVFKVEKARGETMFAEFLSEAQSKKLLMLKKGLCFLQTVGKERKG